MTFAGILWLALLQALSLSAPSRPVAAAVPVRTVEAAHARRVELVASRSTSGATGHELRAGRAIAAGTVPRASRAAPFRDGASLAPLRPARALLAGADVRSALRGARDVGHAVASRGSLLAYFPTAPPLPV